MQKRANIIWSYQIYPYYAIPLQYVFSLLDNLHWLNKIIDSKNTVFRTFLIVIDHILWLFLIKETKNKNIKQDMGICFNMCLACKFDVSYTKKIDVHNILYLLNSYVTKTQRQSIWEKKKGFAVYPLLCLYAPPVLTDGQHSAGINPWLNLSLPFFGSEDTPRVIPHL